MDSNALGLAVPAGIVGLPTTGAVFLLGGGPLASDTAVVLAATNAQAPGSVTVPAGSLSAIFPLTPTDASYSVAASASGLSGSGDVAATATVLPPLAPPAIEVLVPAAAIGDSGLGTVTLTGDPAPQDTVVSLQGYGCTVPASITIAQGDRQATFSISPTLGGYVVTAAVQVAIAATASAFALASQD